MKSDIPLEMVAIFSIEPLSQTGHWLGVWYVFAWTNFSCKEREPRITK